MTPSTHAPDLLERLGWLVVRLRVPLLLAGFLLAAVAVGAVQQLRLYDDPSQWPPSDHPLVMLNNRIQERFGGSNLVSITVTVRDGDIFNPKTLAKVKWITEKLLLIHGVIPYTVTSLSVVHVKFMKFHPPEGAGGEEFLEITPLMDPNRPPRTQAEAERVREGVFNGNDPTALGYLASPDGKAARILADFRTVPFKNLPVTDPVAIFTAVQQILAPENDANHVVRATGTPIIIGWVNSEGLVWVRRAFAVFLVAVAGCLWLSFRNVTGVVLPIAVGLIGSLLGFLLYRVFFGEVLHSASVLIMPFIVVAAGSFHAVQFLKRFFTHEMPNLGDVKAAAVRTFASRFMPMIVSLVTDTVAFVVLAFIPFENVRMLGITTAGGLLCVAVGEFLFLLPALTLLRHEAARSAAATGEGGPLESWLRSGIRPLVESRATQRWIVAGLVLAVMASLWSLRGVRTGQDNTYAIHNFLTRSWERNPIYEMEMDIRERFGGVYPLSILIEARGEAKKGHQPLQDPQVLEKMDEFAAHLEEDPSVDGTVSLALFIKAMHRFMNGERDDLFIVPDDANAIGTYFYFYESGRPGAFDAFVDPSFRAAVLTAMVHDTRPETVERLLRDGQAYARERFDDEQVSASVAGGAIGIAGAFNESIGKWLLIGSLLSAAATYVVAAILLRSLALPAFLLIPLATATVLWLGLIHLLEIELNSNTVTALAIATGVGIDPGVYLLFRFRERVAEKLAYEDALISSFADVFRPLAASNGALILGCWALVPIPLYLGYVGFGMGAILLLASVLSFLVHPIVWSLFRGPFAADREVAEVARIEAVESDVWRKAAQVRRERGLP